MILIKCGLCSIQAGVKNESAFQKAQDILIPLGEYFQVQDDYLDCYGDPAFIGKIGTDIQDNKCSWLINQALAKANPEQRKILDVSLFPDTHTAYAHMICLIQQENYGKKDAAAEAKIKDLYREMDIEGLYKAYEEESYKKISGLIGELDESVGVKKAVFTEFMDKIYKRTKQSFFLLSSCNLHSLP